MTPEEEEAYIERDHKDFALWEYRRLHYQFKNTFKWGNVFLVANR